MASQKTPQRPKKSKGLVIMWVFIVGIGVGSTISAIMFSTGIIANGEYFALGAISAISLITLGTAVYVYTNPVTLTQVLTNNR